MVQSCATGVLWLLLVIASAAGDPTTHQWNLDLTKVDSLEGTASNAVPVSSSNNGLRLSSSHLVSPTTVAVQMMAQNDNEPSSARTTRHTRHGRRRQLASEAVSPTVPLPMEDMTNHELEMELDDNPLHGIAKIILYPIADTWLEYNDATPYGDKKRLKVDGNIQRVTLLKFDLSSLPTTLVTNKNILGAGLKMYALTNSPFGGKIDLLLDQEECNGWDEYTISWTNAPECILFREDEVDNDANRLVVGQFGAIPEFEWNEARLYFDTLKQRQLLPEWITLRVTSHHADGVTYASRENVTAIPELLVYYNETEGEGEEQETTPALELQALEPTTSPNNNIKATISPTIIVTRPKETTSPTIPMTTVIPTTAIPTTTIPTTTIPTTLMPSVPSFSIKPSPLPVTQPNMDTYSPTSPMMTASPTTAFPTMALPTTAFPTMALPTTSMPVPLPFSTSPTHLPTPRPTKTRRTRRPSFNGGGSGPTTVLPEITTSSDSSTNRSSSKSRKSGKESKGSKGRTSDKSSGSSNSNSNSSGRLSGKKHGKKKSTRPKSRKRQKAKRRRKRRRSKKRNGTSSSSSGSDSDSLSSEQSRDHTGKSGKSR